LEEAVAISGKLRKTGCSAMHAQHELPGGSAQKWFVTGEAISHLRFLEEKRLVTKEKNDSGIQKYRAV